MSKYFIDCEFIEGFKKPISWLPTIGNFNKEYHSIQLVSIGIVCEDGREYYAISEEYNYKDASDWVKKNVIAPMYRNIFPGDARNSSSVNSFHKYVGKSNKQIAGELVEFIYPRHVNGEGYTGVVSSFISNDSDTVVNRKYVGDVEFYAYYADYDWIVFCSLFGTMMDLPEGFPMYCRDLKQELDRKAEERKKEWFLQKVQIYTDFDMLNHIKTLPNYPKQENEHDALDDAKWNSNLYKFLQNL